MNRKPLWKVSFDARSRSYELSSNSEINHDVAALYFELERLGCDYIRLHNMRGDESYNIYMDNGDTLRMRFITCEGEPRATLSLVAADSTQTTLVSETDLKVRDYSRLKAYASSKDINIGHRFPDRLKDLLKTELLRGRILSFDISGKGTSAYVCTSNSNGIVTVKRIHSGSIKDVTARKFAEAQECRIRIDNDRDIQALYNEVKTFAGNVIPRCTDIDCFAQELVNATSGKLKPGRTAVLRFGSEQFHVKRSLVGNRLTWYDKNGEKITEESAKVFIAWCHDAPTIIEPTKEDKLLGDKETYAMYYRYESLLMERRFGEAALVLEALCADKDRDFAINFHTFSLLDKDPEALTFCFKSEPTGCEIYRVTYQNNDFNCEPARITHVDIDEFAKLCMDKYIEMSNAITGRLAEEYGEQMKDSSLQEDLKSRIIKNAAAKSADKKLSGILITEMADVTDIDTQLSHLIDSYAGMRPGDPGSSGAREEEHEL